MKIFRRVPVPFAISYLGSGLIYEAIQKRKADKYAAQVVRQYQPGELPYSYPKIGTLEDELEKWKELFPDNE